MIQNYCVINQQQIPNVCENIVLWDGDTSKWNPGEHCIVVPKNSTPTMEWEYVESSNTFVMSEHVGTAGVGYTWDGTHLITNAPQPTEFHKPVIVADIKDF